MKTLLQQKLRDKLSLSSKILLRRIYAGSTRPFVQLVERLKKPEVLQDPPTLPAWNSVDCRGLFDRLSRTSIERRIRTSIIIPAFNKVDFTFHCLTNLLSEIDLHTTEVIVVNDGSSDDTREMLNMFKDLIQVLNNEGNRGFVDACNQGAAAASGEYLVFLNNDTMVLPGWLEDLQDTIDSDSSIGAVGSMFLYPNGKIQEAGAIVWKTGEAYHYGWGKSPDDRRYNFAREVDYCSAASLLVRKDLFDELGGFDQRYAPAYYEDVDICFGVRSLGYKVVYQPQSRVIHYEGVTAGRDTAVGTKHYQIINRKKFYEKWREVLERDHFDNDLALADQASNRKRGPQFIVFDDRVPTPDRDAGSGRMFHILKALARVGRPVFVSLKPLPEYEALLWKEGIETANVVQFWRLIKKRNFKVAVLSRPEVTAALFKSVRRADKKIKMIFDMVDAYFIRLGREHEVTGEQHLAEESKRFAELELSLARASDQVWCNSSHDKKVVSQHIEGERVVVVPTIHELHDRGKAFEEREGLLFVGHLKHRPNSDAVHYFIREVYPLIREALPEVILYIVGSSASPEINAYDSDSVKVMGYVPDINPILHSARVFVAPIRFGAGTKGKVGDAMAYGLPVVTTSIGAEGFDLTSGEDVMIADNPNDFASSVVRVYRDEHVWQRLADNAYRRIENNFTPQVIGKTIESGLRNLGVLNK